MSVALIIITVVALGSALCNVFAEYSRVMMMMQQNSYRPDRYGKWLRSSGDTTSYPRLVGLIVLFASMAAFSSIVWGLLLVAVFSSGSAIVLFGRKYKKPLVWTSRIKRIFSVMTMLSVIVVGAAAVWGYLSDGIETAAFYGAVALMALYCGSHIVVLSAVRMLQPVEKRINKKYYDEAAAILRSMPSLKVVGITGSYGKTSTKHYLHRILSEHFETLMTPGSYNTTMGVIRTVREMMKPYCEVFICEMGAKQKGDIREICDLVHPDYGILTAVGPQHLESFKTIENVRDTKFELIDSLPADGFAVINNDFPQIASREVANVECARYGVRDKKADYCADNIVYGEDGTDFVIIGDGRSIALHTPLVGECNVSNLIAAVVMALKLGVPEAKIRQAVARIAPVEHRLSMKRTAAGITIIDDAFNSNPSGSEMALDVLRNMKSGRRIVVTPGMIELGEQQYELNRQFGKLIARAADIAVIVGQYNRQAITEGIESEGNSELQLIEAPTFKEAMAVLSPMLKRGDVVLLENDLPDTFK